MNIEVMKLALDALESRCGTNADERLPGGAIPALRAALSQQSAAGEPVTESFVQQVPDHCDRVLWRGRYLHLPMTRPENVAAKQDAAALNWIERQHLEELGMGLVIDAPNDGMYYVCGDSGTTHYGKTLREALASAAIKQPAPATQTEVTDGFVLVNRGTIESAMQHVPYRGEVWQELNAAILALRPERVPMTDEVEKCAVVAWAHFMDTCRKKRVSPADWGDWCSANAIRKAHHGITTKAKGEQ